MPYVATGYVEEGYIQEGLSVNPSTYVITVPQSFLTFVSGSTYSLDTNAFRIALRDFEDSEKGIAMPKTHTHNTQVTLGGIQYSRVLEVLAPYTITFEETVNPYVVSLTGSNNNILERTNLGSVQILANNSAGLINVVEIQRAAFNEAITFKEIGGTPGTTYPTGTPAQPSDNIPDSVAINAGYGFNTMRLIGDLDAGTGHTITGWSIIGISTENHVHLDPGSAFTDVSFSFLHIHGDLYGVTQMHDCVIGHINGFAGELMDCTINDTVEVSPGQQASIIGCRTGQSGATIDCGGALANVNIRGITGDITLSNITSGAVSVSIVSGSVTLDATCTGGSVVIDGTARVTDNSAGTTLNVDGVINDQIEQASYGDKATLDPNTAYTGTVFPVGTRQKAVNNLADAQAICTARGFNRIDIIGDYTFQAADDVRDFHIWGEGATINVYATTLVMTSGMSTSNAEFHHARMQGEQKGETLYTDCVIDGISNAHCKYQRCAFLAPRTGDGVNYTVQHGAFADGTHTTELHDCYTDEGTAVIDRNGARMNQRWIDFSGNLKFINQNHATESGSVWVHVNGGTVEIDSSCTQGFIFITGDCEIINNTGGTQVRTGLFQSMEDTRYAIEALRSTHQGAGTTFYVDPLGGLDTNTGRSAISSLQTIAAAHTLCRDGANDVIQVINPSAAGVVMNETINITKNNVHFRATSRDITFKPAVTGGPIMNISGYSCSVLGPLIDGDRNGGGNTAEYCMEISGKFCLIGYVWAKQATKSCIRVTGGDYHVFIDPEFEKANEHGILIEDLGLPSGSPREITVRGYGNIYLNDKSAIKIGDNGTGPKGSTTRIIRVLEGNLSDNGEYAVDVGQYADKVLIGETVIMDGNGLGKVNDPYSNALDMHMDRLMHVAEHVWNHLTTNITVSGSIGVLLKGVLTVKKFVGLK